MSVLQKTLLVTGGSGLVGNTIKYVSDEYKDNYNFIFIYSKDYDLSILDDTKKMFELYRPNYVIHLAACVGLIL